MVRYKKKNKKKWLFVLATTTYYTAFFVCTAQKCKTVISPPTPKSNGTVGENISMKVLLLHDKKKKTKLKMRDLFFLKSLIFRKQFQRRYRFNSESYQSHTTIFIICLVLWRDVTWYRK